MGNHDFFAETVCKQAFCGNGKLSGDCFLQQYLPGKGHSVVALSDGLGHGVKANVLSTLTASIFMGMAGSEESVEEVAQTVIKTLPVCSAKKISYSTFTLTDIDHRTGVMRIVEYDNPQAFIFREGKALACRREVTTYTDPVAGGVRRLYTSRFVVQWGDRVVLMTDGVTQSGLGTERYPFGWGRDVAEGFLEGVLSRVPEMGATELASRLLDEAVENDGGMPRDDISCAVVHIREPRRALLCSCPPSLRSDVERLAEYILGFEGKKVVCGHLLAESVAGYWQREIRHQLTSTDPELPPQWEIEGLDLVTEGLLTLSKVLEILENFAVAPTGRGPAYHICELLLEADRIEMVVGMRKSNMAAADAESLILRRKVLGTIARVLETRFSKLVVMTYL